MQRESACGQRGGSKLGCLVLLVLVGILGYLVYQIVPVYTEQDDFHDELLRIAGRATVRGWDNRTIIRQVQDTAAAANFDVERANIRIERVQGRPEVILVVDYSRTQEFPGGYIYTFHFHSVAQGSLGF